MKHRRPRPDVCLQPILPSLKPNQLLSPLKLLLRLRPAPRLDSLSRSCMADEPGAERLDEFGGEEGGPVKSFLEHLEDLRWVLIKSLVAAGVAVLLCLIAGDNVVKILKRPLAKAKISYPGTNQVVTVLFDTNRLGVYTLSPNEQAALNLGTNRFVAVHIEPMSLGTNQVLALRVDNDPKYAQTAQGMNVELVTLSPASGFFVAFQVALYGGLVL